MCAYGHCVRHALQYGPYGTRSQVVIAVWPDGSAEARERFLDDSKEWQWARFEFKVATLAGSDVAGPADTAKQ